MKNQNILKVRLSIAVSLLFILYPFASNAQEWSHSIEPYVLAASLDGSAGAGRVTGLPVEVGFDDILENLEMAGMLHYEAHHRSGWGLALDYGFMDLGSELTTARGGIVEASVHQGLLEAIAIHRTEQSWGTLDLTVGLRWWDIDVDVTIDPAILPGDIESNLDQGWMDIVVGARALKPISEDWTLQFRFDLGGLGLESDFTSSVAAGAQYQMSDNWVLDLQYKGTWVDFEDGEQGASGYFSFDTLTHGPLVGLSYQF